jgi:hypothetical protein
MYALRRFFGGGGQGGPRGFAPGGAVFTPRDVDQTVPALTGEVRRALNILRNLANPTSAKSAFTRSLRELTGQGGLLDQLSDAIDTMTTNLATSLQTMTFHLNKLGLIVKRSDVKVAEQAIINIGKTYTALVGEKGTLTKELNDINKRIEKIRAEIKDEGGKATPKQRKALARLRGYGRAIQKRIDTVDESIAQSLQDSYEAVENAIQTRQDHIQSKADIKTGAIDLLQRTRAIIGGTALGLSGAPSNASLGQQRADVLSKEADQLTTLAFRAGATGHKDTAQKLMEQVAELRVQVQEAIVQGISDDVDEVNRQFDRRNAAIDLRSKIASVLGRVNDVAQAAQDHINSISDQIATLTQEQQAAQNAGATALAEQIGDQIADLQTSIVELAAQQISDAADAIDAAAQRRSAGFDIRDRLAALMDSAGNKAGAFALRGQTLVERGNSIRDQINALVPLLVAAQQQGNIGETDKLTDEIADLNTQLAENAAAIKENTVQARQAAIDAILGRSGFLTGVFGGLEGLVQAVAAVTGTIDLTTQRQLIQQTISTLQTAGGGLAQQLFEAFGIDVRGASPAQLVSILSSLNFDGIEANFSDSQRQQFEALISAIIENATSVQQNTDQLNQITNPTSQSFTSTAWQWFRNAIFNGSGGLLPQYQIPSSLGAVTMSSMSSSSTVQSVAAGNASSNGSSSDVFAPSITNVEQTVDLDPDTLANRLFFRFQSRAKGS